MSRISTESLARAAAAHPWRTLLIWVAAVVAGVFLIATLLGSATTFEGQFTNDPDSQVARDLIEERIRPTHADEVALFRSPTLTVDDVVFRSAVEEFTERTRELGSEVINTEKGALQITNFYETGIDAFVSENRKTTLVPLTMAGDIGDASDNIRDVIDIADEVAAESGIEVLLTGPASIGIDFQEIAQEDLIKGESIGIAIALVILLLVFRAAGSSWIPVVVALISIMLAIAAVSVIGQISEFSFFVTNIITMVGLAVGIDYSLFIIARFREERARGLEKQDAIGRAGATATRAVVFSGITVVLALFGMVMVPTTVFFSIGLGAVFVTIIAVIAALTMLPAILSLLGDRVNAWKLPFVPAADGTHDDETGGFWNAITRIVMGHPWPALIIVVGLLVAATIPYFGIKTGAAGIDTLPSGFTSLQAFNILRDEFPGQVGGVSAADIVIDGDVTSPEVQAGIERLRVSLEGHPIFGAVTYETSDDGVLGH